MIDYGSEILEMLEGQADHYQTLMRIMLRQAECLRKDDLIGVGSATAEIRKVMEHVDGLGNSLTPLIAQWGGPCRDGVGGFQRWRNRCIDSLRSWRSSGRRIFRLRRKAWINGVR